MAAPAQKTQEIPPDWSCSICYFNAAESTDVIVSPHSDADGKRHPFHLNCLIQALAIKNICPFCKVPDLDISPVLSREEQRSLSLQRTAHKLSTLFQNIGFRTFSALFFSLAGPTLKIPYSLSLGLGIIGSVFYTNLAPLNAHLEAAIRLEREALTLVHSLKSAPSTLEGLKSQITPLKASLLSYLETHSSLTAVDEILERWEEGQLENGDIEEVEEGFARIVDKCRYQRQRHLGALGFYSLGSMVCFLAGT